MCPNFDLCGACEAAGVHRHHTMLRVCDPTQPNYGLDQSSLFQQRQTYVCVSYSSLGFCMNIFPICKYCLIYI